MALFNFVRTALGAETLLPRFGGGYISAACGRLAGTKELRDLINHSQLAEMFKDPETSWLSETITHQLTAELREYLMRELGVAEVAPETILSALSHEFLELQSDKWMLRFYEFLYSQPSVLRQRAKNS